MHDLKTVKFEELLKQYRKSRGLTLEDLGNKISKTKATVSKYENGEIIPDILTILDICNVLDISLSQLFPMKDDINHHSSLNPFKVNRLYLYYYTENIPITSILEIKEEANKILVRLYNGVKNVNTYADESSYYYEGILECDKTVGYLNLYNSKSQNTQLEKVQISFLIPWSKDFKITHFFIMGLTPNSNPIVKRGILSIDPIKNISDYKEILEITKDEFNDIKRENGWILENKNYDEFFFL